PMKYGHDKEKVFMLIRKLVLENRNIDPTQTIEEIFDKKYDKDKYNTEYSASWADIKKASSNPLCTIGAHTISHRNLSLLQEDEARKEINESKKKIESNINKCVNHIAYPFGGEHECGDREFLLAKQAGFHLGLTTKWGCTFNSHSKNILSLPRIHMTDKINWNKLQLQILKRTYYNSRMS
ncbi:MAG: hypothetical protein EOO43_17200, partial [Flavobacterium sp.]